MTKPVVDVVGRAGVADDKTGVIVPVYPQSGKAEVFTWQLRALVADALAKCRVARLRRPARRERARPPRPRRPRHARCARSTGPSRWPRSARPRSGSIFDEFLRMQVGLVARKRALAAEESGIRHDGRRAARRRVPRAAAVRAHRRPTARASPRSRTTWPGRRRCTACCRATSARARPSSRSPRCSSRCRAATRARSWRRPRCSPSSTTSARCSCSKG